MHSDMPTQRLPRAAAAATHEIEQDQSPRPAVETIAAPRTFIRLYPILSTFNRLYTPPDSTFDLFFHNA